MKQWNLARGIIKESWAEATFWGRVAYVAKVLISAFLFVIFWTVPIWTTMIFTNLYVRAYTDSSFALAGISIILAGGLYGLMIIAFKSDMASSAFVNAPEKATEKATRTIMDEGEM